MTKEQLCNRVIDLHKTFQTQGTAKRCWDLFLELREECEEYLKAANARVTRRVETTPVEPAGEIEASPVAADDGD
jgi:hypothetical protein